MPESLEKNKKCSLRLSLEMELHQLGADVVVAVIGLRGLLLCCRSFTSFCLLPFRNVNAVLSAEQHCPL